MELPVKVLTKEEKVFVKQRLLEVTSIIESWQQRYNDTFAPQKPLTMAQTRKMILSGSLEEKFPEIIEDKKKISSFANDYVESLGGTLEYTIVCSFAQKCHSIARNRARKISATLNVSSSCVYEDLVQDSYHIVCHAMYYFTDSTRQLSTFIIDAIKKNIERRARYDYAKLSPMSPEDTIDTYRCAVSRMQYPSLTVEDLAEELSMDPSKVDGLLLSMSPIVRVSYEKKGSDNETSIDIIAQIPDPSSSIEESDNIDTVSFLKGVFDEVDDQILNLSKEERDVLKAACVFNFERGWQASFARQYINPSSGKPYTRARIGQIYNSALCKVRSLVKERV
jgi:DNA-directed RNA polymerase specialized sigma subunit